MKKQIFLNLILYVFPAFAAAQNFGYPLPSNQNNYGTNYNSGNAYSQSKTPNSKTLNGYNYNTGSTWSTTYNSNGTAHGRDSKGDNWTYDNNTGYYYNFGTGKFCTGKGYARFCN